MKNLLKITGIMMLGAAVLFTGCKKDKDEKFSVTATANNPEWGVVVGGGEFDEGTEIVLAATANEGYHFVKWSNELTDNPLKLVVTKNESLIAYFAEGNGGNGGNGTPGEAQTLSGTINENVTWKDLGLPVDYIIDGTVYLDGNALVTVEAGVTIMFANNGSGISVGANAGFKIAGTAEKPVLFTGPTNNQNPGSWDGIRIDSKRSENVWEYATFENGGAYSTVLSVVGGTVAIKNCTINGALHNGLSLYEGGKLTAFENTKIMNCGSCPIHSDMISDCLAGTNNTFENNAKNYIYIRDYALNEENVTYNIKKAAIPYFFSDGLEVWNKSTLTIEAGTQLLFSLYTHFWADVAATVKAEGTADNPIVFAGLEDKNGYWNEFGIYCKTPETVFNYCTFKNVGNDDSNRAIFFGGESKSFTFKNCTVNTATKYGIVIDNAESTKTIVSENNKIEGATDGKVVVLNEYTKEGEEDPCITENQTFDSIEAVKNAIK